MERKLRKLLALVTAFSLSMSLLGVTAFADEDNSPPSTDTESDTVVVEDHHNPINCKTCKGLGTVKEDQTCPTCLGVLPDPLPMTTCPDCGGTKMAEDWDNCPTCNGRGTVMNDAGEEVTCPAGCFSGNIIVEVPCTNCDENGQVVDKDKLCSDCKGIGTVKVDVPCTNCEGTGKVHCTGDFTGKLTKVDSKTYEGTMTYECKTCKAKYTETMSADDTWNAIVDSVDVSLLPTDKDYRKEQPRTNSGAPLFFKLKFNSILFKSFQLKCSAAVQFDEHVLAMGYTSNSKAKYDPETNSISVSSVNFNNGVNFKMLTTKGTGDDKVVATNPGDAVNVTGTITLTMGDKTQDFPISATVQINKFPVTSSGISLVSLNAAVYPASTPSRNLLTATSKAASLEDMPGNTFDFDSIFSPSNGFKNSGLGAAITNQNTDRIWTCVGFIPCTKYDGTADSVKELVFNEDEAEAASEGFTLGTLEDAQQYVSDHFGVLYGTQATDENIQTMVNNGLVSGSYGKLAIVWYVAKPQEFKHNEYGDLTIPAVPSAAYQPTSQGVEIKPDLDSVHAVDGKPHTFEGELTVTIGSSAPNTIHINLSDALTALMGRASHLDNNAIQPGDVMNYHVKLVNNSGKDFQYVADSAFAATIDRYVDGQQSLGTGFDGYQIAASLPDGSTEFCAIPRRVANDALKFLGVDKDLSDEAIGALLLAKGYGEGEDLTPAEITQKYLAPFYLDFLNSQRAEDTQLAHSFLDLTGSEFARLTNYDNKNGYQPGVPETCETVAQAFYYFYYGVNYTVNGTSIYDQMKDHAAMDQLVSDALSGDGTYTLASQIAGETTNNAFQDTAFRFGMQFSMAYTPTSAPDGPGGGGGGGRDDDPTPPAPPVDIPEEPTPLAPLPGEDVTPEQPAPDADAPLTDLPDEEVPKADVPKTGDASLLWLALSGLSGSGLAALALQDRRKKHDN